MTSQLSDVSHMVTASPAARAAFDDPAADVPVDISVVIVSYGTGDVLDEALSRLDQASRATDRVVEVVVVDQLHPDRGHSTADRLSLTTAGVHLVRPDANLGFGGGNELGVVVARGRLLCFLNPDVFVPTDFFDPLIDTSIKHPLAIIAPRLVDLSGTLVEAGQILDRNGRTRAIDASLIQSVRADYASAACWVLPRHLHELVGGFDPRYHPAYFEDVDYALRLERVGGTTEIVDLDVVHLGGASVDGPVTHADLQREIFIDRWGSLLSRRRIACVEAL